MLCQKLPETTSWCKFLHIYFISNFVNYVTILNLSHGHTDRCPELSLILLWANSLSHCKTQVCIIATTEEMLSTLTVLKVFDSLTRRTAFEWGRDMIHLNIKLKYLFFLSLYIQGNIYPSSWDNEVSFRTTNAYIFYSIIHNLRHIVFFCASFKLRGTKQKFLGII